MSQLAPLTALMSLPALIASAGDRAGLRFLEFLDGTIRNPHTRRAYARATGAFLAWCEDHGVASIDTVQPSTSPPGSSSRCATCPPRP